jgi:hypothetical protein
LKLKLGDSYVVVRSGTTWTVVEVYGTDDKHEWQPMGVVEATELSPNSSVELGRRMEVNEFWARSEAVEKAKPIKAR